MRLIDDIFTRAELAGESGRWLVRADRFGPGELESRPAVRGATAAAPGAAVTPGTQYDAMCVHFTGRGAEHSLWLAETMTDEASETTTDGIALSWQRGAGGVLRGEVCLRGSVVCDVLVPAGMSDPRVLRSLGLTRAQAAVLAQSGGRPVLATFSHGPALPPAMQRQVHRLLIASLARWSRLRQAC